MSQYLSAVVAALLALPSAGADAQDAAGATQLEDVVVTGVRQRLDQAGTLVDVIAKTEVIGADTITARHAVSLTEAVALSPGVRVSNECSMCGVKRLMLNGMRGEHTTILTDGLPLHTMLAGFYALDAMVMAGVDRIEIARGAGASLIAPEAVGGSINVISLTPDATGVEIDGAVDDEGGYVGSALGTLVSDDGRTRASLVIQVDEHSQIDADRNDVSESPQQDNRSVILRVSHDLSDRDNLVVRGAYTDSEIFGGPTAVSGIAGVLAGFDGAPSETLFEDDDVRGRWLGKPWETTEWIDTSRTEFSATWLHDFGARFNTSVSAAISQHEQDSFYEGFDYQAEDELVYFDVRNNFALNDAHLLTFGVDRRDERMRSDSRAGAGSPDYVSDSFDYKVTGLYLQDTWNATDSLEVALALRVDSVTADFVAPQKPGAEIDEVVLAPRLDLRYRHGPEWTSRLSVGRGYRAPLSFFESDHGLLDAGDGFAIEIDQLEDSLSANYSLSHDGERVTATASLAYTRVEHLAAIDETPSGVPRLTQLDETASVLVADLALGYRVTSALTLEATIEQFEYNDAFKQSFGVAPVEQRATLTVDYSAGPWHAYGSAVRIGSRDLAEFGYEGFNVLGSAVPKSTDAPHYWTLDLRVARDFGERFTVYAGVSNLLDETQVLDMDTPLFWDADGGYDVAFIYGPLRGREMYAGMTMRF